MGKDNLRSQKLRTENQIVLGMKASLNPLAAHRDSRKSSRTSHSFDITNMNNQQSRHDYLKFEPPMFEIYILGIERSRGKKNHDLVIEANIEGYYS